jgi:citrate lyase beta subunit
MTTSPIRTSLSPGMLAPIIEHLDPTHTELARRYPGETGLRQPVHTVYGGAQLFTAETATKLGQVARRALEEYAPDAATLARAIGLPGSDVLDATELAHASDADLRRDRPHAWLARAVYERVREKLEREPVEDFRIDYEDGYGVRPDAEEDGHAAAGAREVARGMKEGTLPPFIGIRVKPLTAELHARSLRTLDIFLTTLVREAGSIPERFVLTLPKITAPQQVLAFAEVLAQLETELGLPTDSLKFEVMVETPQLIIDSSGRSQLPALIDASQGRLTAAHFGTYDYTASLSITAAYQRMRHVACDFARSVMQVAYAGTGVWLSDGSTTVMPVPVHRAPQEGTLSAAQLAENRASVHGAWRMHYEDVRHSLASGFYQGWDLHPAQLVTRYAAVYAFFLSGLEQQAARLKNFVERAAQATLVGDVFDDAATGQGLLNFFLRALNCGALSEADVVEMTGVTLDELRTRSFVRIMEGRRSQPTKADAVSSRSAS